MTLKEIAKFKEIFTGWSEKEINIAYQMILFLDKVRVPLGDFEEYAKYLQNQAFYTEKARQNLFFMQIEFLEKNSRKCGKCGTIMDLGAVNTAKCNQIPDKKIKSVFTCLNIECTHQVWSQKSSFEYENQLNKRFLKTVEGMTEKEIADLNIDRSKYKLRKNNGGCSEVKNGR